METLVRVPRLTDREIQVLRAWLLHDTKEATARTLFVSHSTVNTHISRIRVKYEEADRPAKTKASLLARAIQDGYITLEEL